MKNAFDSEPKMLQVSLREQEDDRGRQPMSMEEEATISRIRDAQDHLERIRKEHEELNRLREQLETRQQKQNQFSGSRRELMEKFNRSLMALDKEILDAEKLLDHLQVTRDSFARHVTVLRSFHPENWPEGEIQEQLDRALASVEEAASEHQKQQIRLQTLRHAFASGATHVSGGGGFLSASTRDIVRAGLLFCAPLMACLTLLLLISLIFQ